LDFVLSAATGRATPRRLVLFKDVAAVLGARLHPAAVVALEPVQGKFGREFFRWIIK